MRFLNGIVLAAFVVALPFTTEADEVPASVPGIEAPKLAALGPFRVGVRDLTLVHAGQYDFSAPVLPSGEPPKADRKIPLRVWYPANGAGLSDKYTTYVWEVPIPSASGPMTKIDVPVLAQADAPPASGKFPLIILSHGFGGGQLVLNWAAENLASKGYVVAAPAHNDPPFGSPKPLSAALYHRAIDIAFVASELRRLSKTDASWRKLIDVNRVGIIGYSMGGYGALRVAGATFNPKGVPAGYVPAGVLMPLTEGAMQAPSGAMIEGLKAVVAVAPWGGQASMNSFSTEGLSRVKTPTLFLVGTRDDVSGYEDGVKTLYDGMKAAPKHMLVFQSAGHSIGTIPAPAIVRQNFQLLEAFEDPVWSKRQVIGISLHFMTAFLDRYVKGDASMTPYVELSPVRAEDGVWPQPPGTPSDGAYSEGQPGVTLWRGFRRRWAQGLEYHYAAPGR